MPMTPREVRRNSSFQDDAVAGNRLTHDFNLSPSHHHAASSFMCSISGKSSILLVAVILLSKDITSTRSFRLPLSYVKRVYIPPCNAQAFLPLLSVSQATSRHSSLLGLIRLPMRVPPTAASDETGLGGRRFLVSTEMGTASGRETTPDFAQSKSSDSMGNEGNLTISEPLQYTTEEATLVESKIDGMLTRKIDLWPPEEIFELLPLLLKSSVFEYAIDKRLEQDLRLDGTPLVPSLGRPGSKFRRRLEHSRSFLASLKYSEQQRLARQWIEGLLEAATESTEAMDERVFELLTYENGVLVEPVQEALEDMLRRLRSMSPDEKTLTQAVLETLQKRVEAEVRTRETPFVRLLALLLRLHSRDDRERVLRTELRNSRVIEEFAAYLEEGADYVARLRLGPCSLPEDTSDEMQKILAILRDFTQTGAGEGAQGWTRGAAPSVQPSFQPRPEDIGRRAVVDVEEVREGGEGTPS